MPAKLLLFVPTKSAFPREPATVNGCSGGDGGGGDVGVGPSFPKQPQAACDSATRIVRSRDSNALLLW